MIDPTSFVVFFSAKFQNAVKASKKHPKPVCALKPETLKTILENHFFSFFNTREKSINPPISPDFNIYIKEVERRGEKIHHPPSPETKKHIPRLPARSHPGRYRKVISRRPARKKRGRCNQ